MLNKQLNELEIKIDLLEETIEENSDLIIEDEFQGLLSETLELFSMIKQFEIDSFPYGEVSEKREVLFSKKARRFNKLALRIKRIKDDCDFEDGLDSDWMFDKEFKEDN